MVARLAAAVQSDVGLKYSKSEQQVLAAVIGMVPWSLCPTAYPALFLLDLPGCAGMSADSLADRRSVWLLL